MVQSEKKITEKHKSKHIFSQVSNYSLLSNETCCSASCTLVEVTFTGIIVAASPLKKDIIVD